MKTRHSPGPWEVSKSGDCSLAVYGRSKKSPICRFNTGMDTDEFPNSQANARLIAAAPEGLRVAMFAYAAILRLPRIERLSRQYTLASLRDYIAAATGRSAEDVQNEFEARNPIAHDDQVRLQIHIPARRQGKTALSKLQKELEGTGWNVEGESGCYEVWNEKLTPGLTLECPTIADVRGEIEAYNARAVKKS